MEVDKLRELFKSIDVNVEDLTDEQVIKVAQTIIGSAVQLANLYTRFVMDSVEVLKETGTKLAAMTKHSQDMEEQ